MHIYNTHSKRKEVFQPLQEGVVKMYICGPTVYNFLHIGNFRGLIFFNTVAYWFKHLGFKVEFVYNYTDIDDKIIQASIEEKKTPLQLSEHYIQEFEKDKKQLKLSFQDIQHPKASEHIINMITFIQNLEKKGFVYVLNASLYFSVKNYLNYGQLSGRNLEDSQMGTRAKTEEGKKHPADFVLWKASKDGEPSWDYKSLKDNKIYPGRPGWHIECSAMSKALLGEELDIHGGGIDLLFPHHENEIAQSESCNDKTFAKYWMHNNMINFGDKKMSKSLGNIILGKDFIKEHTGEVLKFLMLSVHYRSELNFNQKSIASATYNTAKFYSVLNKANILLEGKKGDSNLLSKEDKEFFATTEKNITEAFYDDFNTPMVFAELFKILNAFHVKTSEGKLKEKQAYANACKTLLVKTGKFLSLFQETPSSFLTELDNLLLKEQNLNPKDIDQLVEQRTTARKNKDFSLSDNLRKELLQKGIQVQDLANGTSIWEVNKNSAK
ncbi:MAG: cysteine--tRNA ligase [Bdellovibrionaceae bacterium]|nr:cysteine--tRNA ligase [Pseudobdellovibrionaceae bacterium]